MRIIELEFENLNSYEGKVRIDFNDPAFRRNNNQFVISGETAAGKSTVLDAISLALYGATERAKQIVKNQDGSAPELMNNKSAFCSASIIYSCSKGTFKNTFYQQKANKKKDGKIQNPVCSIENMDTHEFLLNNEKTTLKLKNQTEKLIGLSYDQFIRCILIPQGEFDRFIGSDEREKASILAKLSRTEFYKKVGAKLCEEASELNRRYIEEKKLIDQINVLSDEERREKETEKSELERALEKLGKEINELEAVINTRRKADEAQKAYNDAEAEVKRLGELQGEYSKANDELDKARKADKCTEEYNNLYRNIRDKEKEEKTKSDLEEKLQDIGNKINEAAEESDRCKKEYDRLTEERKVKKALWDKVNELDKKLSGSEASYIQKKELLDKAEKSLSDGRKNLEKLKAESEELQKSISEISAFLQDNQKDEKIGEVTAALREKKGALTDEEKKIKKCLEQKKKYEKMLSDEKSGYEKLLDEKKRLEDEMSKFINSKHVIIAGILKGELKQGNPCPVCGMPYHPESRHISAGISESEDNSVAANEEKMKVAADVSAMSDSIKAREDDIKNSEIAISNYENSIRIEAENIETAEEKKSNLIKEISGQIVNWGFSFSEDNEAKDLAPVIQALSERFDKYNLKNKEKNEKVKEFDKLTERINAIDIAKLEDDKKKSEEAFFIIEKTYNAQKAEREEIFGTKKVKDEEAEFDKMYGQSNRKKEEAEQAINGIRLEETKLNSQKLETEKRITDLKILIEESDRKYKSLLKENGFESEEAYIGSKKTGDEITRLDKYVRNYESKKKSADDAFALAKKNLDEVCREEISDESIEVLTGRLDELTKQNNQNNQSVGSLKSILEIDDKNKKRKEEALKGIEKLEKEKEIFSNIKDMIGKATGDDFEVFVQAIAMKSLIAKANEYLTNILPQYLLIQKENEVDFIVREEHTNGTFSDRNIDNFSGGEKFIISLSFALAIAECAGEKGSVDSIFLDEGFGTLSGQPLRDAISALKKLSSTGKMLGIITHVEPVIQEFMQIEAKKIGDKSILKGPGIYCE